MILTLACANTAGSELSQEPTTDLRTITAGVVATVEAQQAEPTPAVGPELAAYQAGLDEAGITPTQGQTAAGFGWIRIVFQIRQPLESYYREQLEIAFNHHAPGTKYSHDWKGKLPE